MRIASIRILAGAVLLSFTFLPLGATACLTFSLQQGTNTVFGRNFDWDVGVGAVVINPRNIAKRAFVLPPAKPVSWVSKYGSLTFNQFSKEVPVGGMNEKGLVIESMVSKADYPDSNGRESINELQWIQYHLDICATIDDVIASAKRTGISPYAVSLHYYVSDASGRSVAIEFLRGSMVHYTGAQLPKKVLANSPYEESVRAAKRADSRFDRAAHLLDSYDGKAETLPYALTVLDNVRQGDFTKWQVVYDITSRRVYFRTLQSSALKWIDLSAFQFENLPSARTLDVNRKGGGSMNDLFEPYTQAFNNGLIDRSMAGFRKANILQGIKPEHVAFIRQLVDSYKRIPPRDGDSAKTRRGES